jgi:hypothetical protein
VTSKPRTIHSPSHTIRRTKTEQRIMDTAARLLDKIPLSQLVQAAVVDEAHRLGIFAGEPDPTRPYPGPWPHFPHRGDESTDVKARTSITFDPTTSELLERASTYVSTPDLPVGTNHFMLGATFAYLARLKLTDRRLKTLTLPEKFQSST